MAARIGVSAVNVFRQWRARANFNRSMKTFRVVKAVAD